MKLNLLGLFAALALFSSTTFATEYIYRDLMANTLPSPGCGLESEAIATGFKTLQHQELQQKVLSDARLRLAC